MVSTTDRVLQLGDPRLRLVAAPVDLEDPAFPAERERLHATLAAFRAEHGFGRAIAAPQIAILKRFIAADLGEGPFTLIDPVIVWRSDEVFKLWDGCMCFPTLLVRVQRAASISVEYTDEAGDRVRMGPLDRATSELLQHEIDHLDGVLAVDRAVGPEAVISREAYALHRALFDATLDG
jgi:peptide deformylase